MPYSPLKREALAAQPNKIKPMMYAVGNYAPRNTSSNLRQPSHLAEPTQIPLQIKAAKASPAPQRIIKPNQIFVKNVENKVAKQSKTPQGFGEVKNSFLDGKPKKIQIKKQFPVAGVTGNQ